jgi:hypothetical protein
MANPPPLSRTSGLVWIVVSGFVLLLITAAVLWFWASGKPSAPANTPAAPVALAVTAFLVDMVAIALIIIGFGAVTTGRISGFFMSSRNAYSLSKLQMAGWTVVVLAALLIAAEINVLGYFGDMLKDADGKAIEPLMINIPGEVLAALGIAGFSFAATPAILALKATQTPADVQADIAAQRISDNTGISTDRITNVGNVMARTDGDAAHISDIVSGDEVANAGTIDLSKVQQLLITLLLLSTYVVMTVQTLSLGKAIASLPALGPRFVELLALSHAGYLVYKAAPKPPQPAADGQQTRAGAALGPASPIRAPQAAPPPSSTND